MPERGFVVYVWMETGEAAWLDKRLVNMREEHPLPRNAGRGTVLRQLVRDEMKREEALLKRAR